MEHFELPDKDKAWLEGLKQDDENAFSDIYHAHSLKLYDVAYASLKSKEMAQEIVQEIFISLWVNRKTLLIRQSIQAYLIGAVRFQVYNFIDRQHVRERYKNEVLRNSEVMGNSTEQVVEYEELSLAIDRQIESLPQTTRNVFVMSRMKGLSNQEIANHFQLSSKAIEYHITKALKTLRNSLRQVLVIILLVIHDIG